MVHSRLSVSVFAALVAAVGGRPAHAETITVTADGIDSIQAAVDQALTNADADDEIIVPPGTYDETVMVVLTGDTTQQSLLIRGKGKQPPLIHGTAGTAMLIRDGRNVEIRNFALQSASALDGVPALMIDGSCGNIVATKLRGVAGDDVGVVATGIAVVGILLEKCDFSGMSGIGYRLDGMGHDIDGCTANDCGLNALVLTADALLCRVNDFTAHASGGTNAGAPGVITLRGNGHQLVNATVSGGGGDGICSMGSGHTFSDCAVTDNAAAGFRVEGSLALVENSVASGNAVGLLGGGLGTIILNSTFSDNDSHGIQITEGGASLDTVTARQNGGDGLHVDATVFGTNVHGGKFAKNAGEGAMVLGQLTWLEGNSAKQGDGFVDLGTNNHGRGNEVSGSSSPNDF